MSGRDHADRCKAPNLGWLSITYPVANITDAETQIVDRGWAIDVSPYQTARQPYGDVSVFAIKAPDGAVIEFAEID